MRAWRVVTGALLALLYAAAVADGSPPIQVGEEIVYRAFWGLLPVGETVLSTDWHEEEGRRLVRIRLRTRSNWVVSRLYPVDDLMETYMDPDTFRPVRHVRDHSGGRQRAREITDFCHDRGRVQRYLPLREETQDLEIPPGTFDIISYLFYLRALPLSGGERLTAHVLAGAKLYHVGVDVFEETEEIRIRGGERVRSYKLEPEAAFDDIFLRQGRVWFWLATRPPALVTRFSVELSVADIHLVLDDVRRPGRPHRRAPDPGQEVLGHAHAK